MRVYVESNFILELALGQEEAAEAEEILSLTQRGAIELWIPEFALCEPFTTLARRGIERRDLAEGVVREITQLRRSPTHARDVRRLRHVPAFLAGISNAQADQRDQVILSVLRAGRFINLDAAVFASAITYRQRYGFRSMQDAIIYACVLSSLATLPPAGGKCFITRNPRDFERDPRIRSELASSNCALVSRFSSGLGLIRSRVAPPP